MILLVPVCRQENVDVESYPTSLLEGGGLESKLSSWFPEYVATIVFCLPNAEKASVSPSLSLIHVCGSELMRIWGRNVGPDNHCTFSS